MILVDRMLGNRHDNPQLAKQCAAAQHDGRLETLLLPLLVAQRRRFKAVSSVGTEIGVSRAEGSRLRDGDVLAGEGGDTLVVVALETPNVVTFRLDPALDTEAAFQAGVHLGHLLGMQHWECRWIDDVCTVQVTDRAFVAAVLQAHPVEGIRYEFSSLDTRPGGSE